MYERFDNGFVMPKRALTGQAASYSRVRAGRQRAATVITGALNCSRATA
jgi:hypothetical protein